MSMARVTSFTRDGLVFDVRDDGPLDGVPVVLLHGFPQDSRSWEAVARLLHARGHRTLAPDQRGYSPGARPSRRRDYRSSELVADVVQLIERADLGPVHLVGHDWGAAVAWGVAAKRPDVLRSLATLSVPHPAAFLRALVTSSQGVRSWYMYFFQLPVLPERWLSSGRRLESWLRATHGMPASAAARDVTAMRERGRAHAALNWYRAIPLADPREIRGRVSVRTLHVWSDGDAAVTPKGAALTAAWVDGPYTFEVLKGVGHWIPEEAPEHLAELLARHFEASTGDR